MIVTMTSLFSFPFDINRLRSMATKIDTEAKSNDDDEANKYLALLRVLSFFVTSIAIASTYSGSLPVKIVSTDQRTTLSFEDRLTLTIQLAFLDLIPLIVSMFAVIHVRMHTVAVNPMDPRGYPLVEQRQRILQNTLEQSLIKLIISFALATLLTDEQMILLPVWTALFLLGRVTFALGYPFYRSFGMGLNIGTAMLCFFIVLFRFVTEKTALHSIQWK